MFLVMHHRVKPATVTHPVLLPGGIVGRMRVIAWRSKSSASPRTWVLSPKGWPPAPQARTGLLMQLTGGYFR